MRIKVLILILSLSLLLTVFYDRPQIRKVQGDNIKYVVHVVKPGDSLSVIAQEYKGNKSLSNVIEDIKFENNLVNDSIQVGQKLIIKLEVVQW